MTCTPIDGIWATPGIDILAGGYFNYDEVFLNTDHRCLWIDVSFITTFGHNMPALPSPKAKRLHCKDPRLIHNLNHLFLRDITKYNLLERAHNIEKELSYPMSSQLQEEYETIDALRCDAVSRAEQRCRKLRMGQVAFSPEINAARLTITAWALLLKRAKGNTVSSRLLHRSLKKARIDISMKHRGIDFLEEHLKLAYKHYYSIKGSHRNLRSTYLENLADAIAQEGNTTQESVLKRLRKAERQWYEARKIRYLRGKLAPGVSFNVVYYIR
jgi:hypothetical protein